MEDGLGTQVCEAYLEDEAEGGLVGDGKDGAGGQEDDAEVFAQADATGFVEGGGSGGDWATDLGVENGEDERWEMEASDSSVVDGREVGDGGLLANFSDEAESDGCLEKDDGEMANGNLHMALLGALTGASVMLALKVERAVMDARRNQVCALSEQMAFCGSSPHLVELIGAFKQRFPLWTPRLLLFEVYLQDMLVTGNGPLGMSVLLDIREVRDRLGLPDRDCASSFVRLAAEVRREATKLSAVRFVAERTLPPSAQVLLAPLRTYSKTLAYAALERQFVGACVQTGRLLRMSEEQIEHRLQVVPEKRMTSSKNHLAKGDVGAGGRIVAGVDSLRHRPLSQEHTREDRPDRAICDLTEGS